MKSVKVAFADYYGTPTEKILAYEILSRHFRVEVTDRDPDYLIDGGIGTGYLKYPDAVRIVFIGENCCPDFNQFDYAVGFDHLEFGDRYLRMPLFAFYDEFRRLSASSPRTPDPSLVRRKFCSFVVSNGDADPLRVEFFRRLSRYKPVASGGGLLNNVGGRVSDKNAFLAEYKFNIAFENSSAPGYTTEKVVQPLLARSVPVYYGNPRISEDFDPRCLVRVSGPGDVERAVAEIVALDRDDAAYLGKLGAPTFVRPFAWYEERLTGFLLNIFDRPPEASRRLIAYGRQPLLRRQQLNMRRIYDWVSPKRILERIHDARG